MLSRSLTHGSPSVSARNPLCQNLCSKCFREKETREKAALALSETAPSAVSKHIDPKAAATLEVPEQITAKETAAPAEAAGEDAADELPVQKNPNRCFTCNKKVGLTGFKCRCNYIYCSMHRYSDKHECTFDYKALGRDAIAKANPTVVAAKVDKI